MSPSKKNRRAYESEVPDPPDPGEKGAKFLAWLKKRGFMREFGDCEDYCNSIGLDLNEFIDAVGCEKIRCGRTGRDNEVLVVICKGSRKWASKWTREYKTDLPHHSGRFLLSDRDD